MNNSKNCVIVTMTTTACGSDLDRGSSSTDDTKAMDSLLQNGGNEQVSVAKKGSLHTSDEGLVSEEEVLDSSFLSSMETESTCSMEECMVKVEEVLKRSLKVSNSTEVSLEQVLGA